MFNDDLLRKFSLKKANFVVILCDWKNKILMIFSLRICKGLQTTSSNWSILHFTYSNQWSVARQPWHFPLFFSSDFLIGDGPQQLKHKDLLWYCYSTVKDSRILHLYHFKTKRCFYFVFLQTLIGRVNWKMLALCFVVIHENMDPQAWSTSNSL